MSRHGDEPLSALIKRHVSQRDRDILRMASIHGPVGVESLLGVDPSEARAELRRAQEELESVVAWADWTPPPDG